MAFKKGQSGNPGGRPKTPPEIKEMFEVKGPEAFEVLCSHLKHEDARIAQTAASLILDRAYGKAVNISDNTTTIFHASELRDDDLAAIAARGGADAVAEKTDPTKLN